MRNIVDIIIILIFVYLVYTILQESAKRENFSITGMIFDRTKEEKENENENEKNKKDYVFFDYDNTLESPGNSDLSNRIIQPSNYENNQFPPSSILDKTSKETPQEVKDWQKALSCGVSMTPRYTENDKCDAKASYDWKLHKPVDKDLEKVTSCVDPNLPPTIKELYDRSVTDYKTLVPKNKIGAGWRTQGNYTMDAYTPSGWSYVDEDAKDNRMTTDKIYAYDPHFDPYSSLKKHHKLINED